MPQHRSSDPEEQIGCGGIGSSSSRRQNSQGWLLEGEMQRCLRDGGPPPHPKDKEAVQSNTELVALSSGTIPPLAQLRLLSVGGGHTNTFLRACKAGCTTPVASLASVGGRLNAASLAAGNAAFQEAISDGLNWLVVDWRHNCSCFDVIGASRWYIDRTAPQHVAFCCYFWFLVSLRN